MSLRILVTLWIFVLGNLFFRPEVWGWTYTSRRSLSRHHFSVSDSSLARLLPNNRHASQLASTEEVGSSPEQVRAKSTLSHVLQGALLLRNVARHIQEKSNETVTTTPRPAAVTWEVPEWMWEIFPSLNVTRTLDDSSSTPLSSLFYRKPKWMKSVAFQGLTNWAFDMCDAAGDGRINRDELYAGVLLVHLHLAKYVGVVACTPLNRTEVDQLFAMASTQDPLNLMDRQTIGRQAFEDIVIYSCAKISSRMVVYYVLLVLLVPFVTRYIMSGGNQLIRTLPWGGSYIASMQGHTAVLRVVNYGVALMEWATQYLLSVAVVTAIMPRIYEQLQAHVPQWMLPSRQRRLWRIRQK